MRALSRFAALCGAVTVLIGAGAAPAKEPTIIVVSGPLFDPFFGPLKKGADDAAKALGTEYQYSTVQDATNPSADLARLVQQAAARQPDAMVVSNFFPAPWGRRSRRRPMPAFLSS
jgi:simple sugar transport system substrate-binding protein